METIQELIERISETSKITRQRELARFGLKVKLANAASAARNAKGGPQDQHEAVMVELKRWVA